MNDLIDEDYTDITQTLYRCPMCDKTGLSGIKGVKKHFNQKHSEEEVPDEDELEKSSQKFDIDM